MNETVSTENLVVVVDTTSELNRMILEFKLENDSLPIEENHQRIININYDDEYLNAEVAKTRNSSTSESGCSSSASFLSSDQNSTSLSSSLSSSSRQSPIINKSLHQRRIISGVSGRAKHDTSNPTDPITQEINSISAQILNYGDDCGFICNKHLNDREASRDDKHLVNKYYFGLADGVSANRLRGYDAKLFPSALLYACTHFIDKLSNSALQSSKSSYSEMNPTSLIELIEEEDDEEEEDWDEEYEEFKQEEEDTNIQEDEENDCANLNNILLNAHNLVQENQVYGSSTVCLLSLEFYDLHEYGLLSSCNLGDSGYMLIRENKVIFKSQSQSHRYNAPFQLGCTPPELLEHDLYRDKPEDSLCQSHQLKSGDYLVISSDGLFDNLYEDEIALIIQDHMQSLSNNDCKVTSELLDSACQVLVQKASKAGIKRDDILIMLIYID